MALSIVYNSSIAERKQLRSYFLFYTAPTYVSMHEIGYYIYVFFREDALEAQEKVIMFVHIHYLRTMYMHL